MVFNTYNPTFNSRYEGIIRKFEQCGFIPIVTVNALSDVLPLVGALNASNIDVIEIAYRSAITKDVIQLIANKCPNVTVGAGTVLMPNQVAEVLSAGAKFVVTPGFNDKVVDRCIETGIPVFPGCSSASDIDRLYSRGLRVANFFPCEQIGGLRMIQALSAPYPFLRFIPTGGVNLTNLADYLSCNKVLCCAGSFVATPEDLKADSFDNITRKAHQVVNIVMGLKMEGIVLYTDEKTAPSIMKTVFQISGKPYAEGTSSGVGVEVDTKGKRQGSGCIVYSTPDIERALYYLYLRGCTVDKSSVVRDSNNIVEVFLLDKAGNFECKLVRR